MIPITIRFTVGFLLIKYVLSVKLAMKSDVHFQLSDEKAIIPCSFDRKNTNALLNILWISDTGLGQRVLERATSGALFIGQHFKETASLGEGCTLILQNPKPKHCGTYCVTVTVVGEGAVKKTAELIMNSKGNDTTDTSTIMLDQTPFDENITTPGTGHRDEQTHSHAGLIAGIVIATIVLIVACCSIYYKCGANKIRLVILYRSLRTATPSSTTYST